VLPIRPANVDRSPFSHPERSPRQDHWNPPGTTQSASTKVNKSQSHTCSRFTPSCAHRGNHLSAFRRTHPALSQPSGQPSNWFRGCSAIIVRPKLSAKAVSLGAWAFIASQIFSSLGSGSSPSHHSGGQVDGGLRVPSACYNQGTHQSLTDLDIVGAPTRHIPRSLTRNT
jgi:hypothetical protein